MVFQTRLNARRTVASRTLEQTHWPTVLRTDSVKNHGVRKDVLILSRLASSMAILIAIAGVVTPLGLYEALQPAVAIQTRFEYLQDTSPFGFGTPSRSNFSLNRICGGGDPEYMPCPFTDSVVTEIIAPNGNQYYDAPYGVDISIPKTILDSRSSPAQEFQFFREAKALRNDACMFQAQSVSFLTPGLLDSHS